MLNFVGTQVGVFQEEVSHTGTLLTCINRWRRDSALLKCMSEPIQLQSCSVVPRFSTEHPFPHQL